MSDIEEGQPPVAVIQTDEETGVQVKVVSPSGEAVPVDPGSPIDKSAVTVGPEVDAQAQPPSGNAALNDVTQQVKETETDKLYKDLFPSTLFYPPQSEKISVHKVLVLFNPVSGNGTGEIKAQEASKLFADRRITVEQRRLDHSGHAKEIAESEDLSPYDALVVIGGDGTLHEAINGIKRRKDGKAIPLGVIAGGTGNSFAREFFGDNLNDVTTAVDHIARGLVVPVDMMHLSFLKDTDAVYSFNSIHWGLASKVVLTAERLRWMGKAVRYTTAALLELLRGSKAVARVTMENVDGSRSVVEGEFCLIICNNVFSTTGSMKMVPHAKVNDGLVDLILVSSDSTIDLFKMFVSIFSGSHNELPYVHYHQCRGFTIETMAEVKESSSRAATPIGDSSPSSSASSSSAQITKDDIEAAVESEAGEAVVDTERKVKGKPKKDAVTNEVLQEVLDVDGELIEGVFTQIHCELMPRDLRVII